MGHQDQDGEKVRQVSLFDWKLEAATTEKRKNSYIFKSYYLILAVKVSKIRVQVLGVI